MKIKILLTGLAAVATMFLSPAVLAKGNSQSDAQVKREIIKESIASYPGSCACPFNHASNGSSCGRRSAWSKAGGYDPICYADEVTPEMVRQWREQHG